MFFLDVLPSFLGSELGYAEYLSDEKVSTTETKAQLDVMVQTEVENLFPSVLSQDCVVST